MSKLIQFQDQTAHLYILQKEMISRESVNSEEEVLIKLIKDFNKKIFMFHVQSNKANISNIRATK